MLANSLEEYNLSIIFLHNPNQDAQAVLWFNLIKLVVVCCKLYLPKFFYSVSVVSCGMIFARISVGLVQAHEQFLMASFSLLH